LAGSNLNSIYNEIARSSSSNIKDLRSSRLEGDAKSEITLNTIKDQKVIQSLKLGKDQKGTDSINFSKNSKQANNHGNSQKNSSIFNDTQNLMTKITNNHFPIPPSLKKNSQSLTNNVKPYQSNFVYGISKQNNVADQYQTNPHFSEQKKPKEKPIEILIEKDQKEEYQIDVNTPQFQELMGLKSGQMNSPTIENDEFQSNNSSHQSNPRILQYQNSGITFKESCIPRGDSLMSQQSENSLMTETSKTDTHRKNSTEINVNNEYHMISAFTNQKSPSFQPDISGSGQSPEINLKQFLTPESHGRAFNQFSKKRNNTETMNSSEFFIENKQLEDKGSNFSHNYEDTLNGSGADISLECKTENLNFGLLWSPGIEQKNNKIYKNNLTDISGKKNFFDLIKKKTLEKNILHLSEEKSQFILETQII
jgi:hypothetical protein